MPSGAGRSSHGRLEGAIVCAAATIDGMGVTIDEAQKWVTLVGAVAAAVAASLNLWWTYKAKDDKIKVGLDPLGPQIEPGYFLHVVSRVDHPVQLLDWGFVDGRGRLLSVPQLSADEPMDHISVVGSALLETRNSSFATGLQLRDRQIGAYAITTAQTRRTVAFRHDVQWHTRSLLRLRIWWGPSFQ